MSPSPIRTRRWTRVEYERLVDAGVFQPGEPIELIGGQLIVSEPQGSGHVTAVGLAEDALRAAFGPGWVVRIQAPLALDEESEPEPDLAVVPGVRRDYRDAHPGQPVLAVEVAETSLSIDRQHKASLYARAGIADYWVVNLVDRALEVHRRPARESGAPFGWHYESVEVLSPEASVAPLAAPGARITAGDLLP